VDYGINAIEFVQAFCLVRVRQGAPTGGTPPAPNEVLSMIFEPQLTNRNGATEHRIKRLSIPFYRERNKLKQVH
jgi:hypothetical protein